MSKKSVNVKIQKGEKEMSKKLVKVEVILEVDKELELNELVVCKEGLVDGVVLYRDQHDTTDNFMINSVKEVSKEVL